MSMTATQENDMANLLLHAYEVGEMINCSEEVADYTRWKNAVEQDSEIQKAVVAFAKAKQSFEECERFGHFHPDYHAALEVVNKEQQQLDAFDVVRRFKEAESRIDDLLYRVSMTIANAVSESIKVPSNNPLPAKKSCGSDTCTGSGTCSSCS
ncbi:YlbF family regulator [Paenibacillus spongiae]|uniref:YlbF family regulator n=1 Tax=Paenibacillus spongiae TaxID=2909671 RepID=A0ABY5SB41_9BACL|nr:YlbF family regulator [Paenibacillus spongiae]UVI30964.1 YlbF family regulator [Paenibacillus spongiae]